MSVVVTVVNHLCACTLKHETFRAFLNEMNAEYKDLVYHTKEVLQFLKNEPQKFEELDSESWNHNLFFLCDITFHVNDLNTQLQGKDLLIFQLVGAVKAFKMKLQLFRSQLLKGEIIHFPTCAQHILQCQHLELGGKFAQQMEILMQESDRRLTLSQEKISNSNWLKTHFLWIQETCPCNCNWRLSNCKPKHRESTLLDFFIQL